MSTSKKTGPGSERRLLGVLFRGLTLLVPLVVVFGAAEVGVRLLVPAERWRNVDATYHWKIDPALGWVQQPDLDSYSIDLVTSKPIRLRTNADGVLPQTASRERTPGRLRVLLVGDSTIVGAGVEEPQRIHNVLAGQLAGRGLEVEVINAGTQGFATDQSMLRLEQLIGLYRPDLVLHCVCANDFVANTLRNNHGLNKPSFRLNEVGELIANGFDPSQEIPETGRGFRKMIQKSAVYRVLRPRIAVVRARLEGWEAQHLLGMASDWFYDPATLEEVDWPLFGALTDRMRDVAVAHGAAFAVYLHPDVRAVWQPSIEQTTAALDASLAYDSFAVERRVARELDPRGIPVLPLVDYFQERQELGPFHLPRDPHCNATGYRLQAERLAELLTTGEPPLLSSQPRPESDRSDPAARREPPAGRSASDAPG